MKFLLQHIILALAASTSLTTLAAPLPESEEVGTIITMQKRGHFFTNDDNDEVDFAKVTKHIHGLKGKYKHTLGNYRRNMQQAHPLEQRGFFDESEQLEAAEKRATGISKLTPVSMSLWHGPIKLGKQTMECDFDTGSADIIINNSAYTPGTKAVNTNRAFTATYGDGTTASGQVYSDTVSVGGVSATGVAVGRASNDYIDEASEGDVGICGLSYKSISVLRGANTYFDSAMAQKTVTKGSFTFTMAATNSQLYMGGVNPRAKKLVYSPVDPSQGYWTVPSSSIAGVNVASIVDTGTSLIVAPTATAQNLFNTLKLQSFNQGGTLYAYYPCKSPPSIPYKFGAFTKTLSAASMNMGTTNNGQCVLSIVGSDTGLNAIIAGGSFLQNVHAVFDRDQNRIGFASQ